MLMAELRGAQLPSKAALDVLAAKIASFSDDVIDQACTELEGQAIGAYDAKMPVPDTILAHCRRIERDRSASVRTKFCGRCDEGVVRGRSGECTYCQCHCRLCANSGMMVVVTATGNLYNSVTDALLDREVRPCTVCRGGQ